MTSDELLNRWAVPQDDGTYDVYGFGGAIVASAVRRSVAVATARELERGYRLGRELVRPRSRSRSFAASR